MPFQAQQSNLEGYIEHPFLPRAARDADLVIILPTSDVLGWY